MDHYSTYSMFRNCPRWNIFVLDEETNETTCIYVLTIIKIMKECSLCLHVFFSCKYKVQQTDFGGNTLKIPNLWFCTPDMRFVYNTKTQSGAHFFFMKGKMQHEAVKLKKSKIPKSCVKCKNNIVCGYWFYVYLSKKFIIKKGLICVMTQNESIAAFRF